MNPAYTAVNNISCRQLKSFTVEFGAVVFEDKSGDIIATPDIFATPQAKADYNVSTQNLPADKEGYTKACITYNVTTRMSVHLPRSDTEQYSFSPDIFLMSAFDDYTGIEFPLGYNCPETT